MRGVGLIVAGVFAVLLAGCSSPASLSPTSGPTPTTGPTAASAPILAPAATAKPAEIETPTPAQAAANPFAQVPMLPTAPSLAQGQTQPTANPPAKASTSSAANPPAQVPTPSAVNPFAQVPMLPTVAPLPTVPMQPTVAPFATVRMLPTVAPFPTVGKLATVGPFPTVAPFPTVKMFAPPPPPSFPTVDFEAFNGTSSNVSVLAVLPPNAQCLGAAKITSLGKFTGRSFELEVPRSNAECIVPAGMLMKSLDDLQDILVMATEPVAVSAGSATVTIYGNCVNADKHGPRVGSKYVIVGMVDPASDLGRIVAAVPEQPSDQVTVVGLQAAVWAVTNDIDAAHLRRIFPVEEADLASTRAILEKAGVDPASRTLFK